VTGPAWRLLTVALLWHMGVAVAQSSPGAPQSEAGDALRGRAIVASRQLGLCLLCHSAPVGDERTQGNLAPSLAGAGSRWSAAQLRQRIANPRSLNPDSIMPAYARTEGLNRVGPAWTGQALLNDQQINDVVAYLVTLKN